MFPPVPPEILPTIPQPVIGGEIDDPLRQRGELLPSDSGLPMGESQNQEIARRQILRGDEGRLRHAPQVGMNGVHPLSPVPLRSHLTKKKRGVPGEETEKLSPDVS